MKTALVIEDNIDNMVLITRFLKKFGYETLQAFSGKEGFEMTLKHRPDFVILDIQLPDIEGTEVLKMIRTSDIGETIPIIAMTAYAMAGDKANLLAAGCDGYIEKPIDPERVISQIRRITSSFEGKRVG